MHRTRRGLGLAVALLLAASPIAAWSAASSTSAATSSPIGAVPPGDRLEADLVASGTAAGVPQVAMIHAAQADIALASRAAEAAGLHVVDRFDRIGVAVAVGTPDQLRVAATQPGVTRVELDRPIDLALDTSHLATRGEEALQGFEVTTTETVTTTKGKKGKGKPQTTTVTTTETSAPVDGSGVSIAVIDSGIDGTHPFFQDAGGNSKVVRNLKFLCAQGVLIALQFPCVGENGDAIDELFVDVPGNDSDTGTLGGHGTHVAGIAGGGYGEMGDGRKLHGAAPGAKLIGLSVGATLSVYGGDAGMNWVLEHHDAPCGEDVDPTACPPIKVINNSWGGGGRPYDAADTAAKLQDLLVAEGVTVVWAAGNDGGDGTTLEIDGPAQSPTPGVLSVANYDDGDLGTRDGALDSSSSRGLATDRKTYPDVSAPGATIDSSCRPYLPICYLHTSTGDSNQLYYNLGGTSMAAPHIAGIVAQVLQADPSLTPGEIEDVLEDTAHKFTAGAAYVSDPRNPDDTTSFDKGHGLVDVKAAVAAVRGIDLGEGGDGTVATPCAGDVVAVDDAGDATEPTVDVVGARMNGDATGITFSIDAPELAEEYPATYNGYSFYVDVVIDGRPFYAAASRDMFSGDSFSFGRPDPTASNVRQDLTSTGMSGTYTFGQGLTIRLTSEALTAANAAMADDVSPGAPLPALANGFTFGNVSVVSTLQRNAVVVASLPAGDTATSGCTYTVGTGSAPNPPVGGSDGGGTGGETTKADATLGAPGDSDEWDSEPYTDVNQGGIFGECAAPDYEFCDVRRIDLLSTSGPLTVRITSPNGLPVVTDFDVKVYGPDGAQVGSSGDIGTDETVVVEQPVAGRYTIVVSVASAVGDTYHGVATAG